MAHVTDNQDPDEDVTLDDDTEPDASQPRYASRAQGAMVGWAISAGIHGAAIIAMAAVVFAAKEVEKEVPPLRINAIEAPAVVEEKPKMERKLETEVTLDVNVDTPTDKPAAVSNLEVPTEITPAETETNIESETPKGREEAISDSETGGSGAFMAVGAGGGGSGMFGSRTGGGKKRAVSTKGGSKASEDAVDAALRWFKKHQSPNGMWHPERYFENCVDGRKCEPGKMEGDTAHVAITAYAVLCYLGAGYDHISPNKYRSTVKKGLDWLVQEQKANGLFGNRNYEHAIAAMAVIEAYAMTSDATLKSPSQRSIDALLARQNTSDIEFVAGQDAKSRQVAGAKASPSKGTPLGWNYTTPVSRNDASVTGWCVMALKNGVAAGLNVGRGIEGSKAYLEKAWRAANAEDVLSPKGGLKYKKWQDLGTGDVSRFPYTWHTGLEVIPKDGVDSTQGGTHRSLAPVGLVCGVFLGRSAGDILMETLANYVMREQMPQGYPCNTYYMYYNTMAIFQVGGERWQTWNAKVRDMLVDAQRRSTDCFDGSWDWEGTQFHGYESGRTLSTAYNTLCLEVYYRYAQVRGGKQPAAGPGK